MGKSSGGGGGGMIIKILGLGFGLGETAFLGLECTPLNHFFLRKTNGTKAKQKKKRLLVFTYETYELATLSIESVFSFLHDFRRCFYDILLFFDEDPSALFSPDNKNCCYFMLSDVFVNRIEHYAIRHHDNVGLASITYCLGLQNIALCVLYRRIDQHIITVINFPN